MAWRAVVGYEGLYEVSDTGLLRTIRSSAPKMLSLRPDNRSTYLCAYPRLNGKRFYLYVHREVLRAFVGEPTKEKPWALHGDNNKLNNTLGNLRWGSRQENVDDFKATRLHHGLKKTVCPLGHPLVAPNLSPEKARLGHRKCRACTNGRAYAQHYKIPFEPLHADEALAKLVRIELKRAS